MFSTAAFVSCCAAQALESSFLARVYIPVGLCLSFLLVYYHLWLIKPVNIEWVKIKSCLCKKQIKRENEEMNIAGEQETGLSSWSCTCGLCNVCSFFVNKINIKNLSFMSH